MIRRMNLNNVCTRHRVTACRPWDDEHGRQGAFWMEPSQNEKGRTMLPGTPPVYIFEGFVCLLRLDEFTLFIRIFSHFFEA